MAENEDYFPRGGKKPTFKEFKQTSNFLGDAEKTEKKKKRPKKKAEGDDGYLSDEQASEIEKSAKNCSVGLSYKVAKEGLTALGRVSNVSDTKVKISLPCRLQGHVMACHVSEPYNKLLEAYVSDQVDKVRELRTMFRPGQYVAVRVLESQHENLLLSVMPQHINKGKTHTDIQKGALLQAAVLSVEDHGYVMDLGVANTRAFLPKKNANEEVELDIGMVTWCTVKSVTTAPDNSIVTLSSQLAAIQQPCRKKPAKGVSGLVPGAPVELLVDKALENGIEGRIFKEVTCYIQRQHADKVKGKKPALGQKITAYYLYDMPTRKTPFLTLKNIFESTYPDLEKEQQLKEGDIVEDAQVIKITHRSIVLKLGKDSIGSMSLKRIQVDENLADEEVVAKSYPLGSTHKVRVLKYNLSDYRYSVSDDAKVLNEKYFSLGGLAVGQLVGGELTAVNDHRLVVRVGRVHGYVPQIHMFDSGIFVDPKKPSASKLPKKKYKEGQQVRARVLQVDPVAQHLALTLKPSLLVEDLEVLKSYEDALVGKAYTGVVNHVSPDYMLVQFFNQVRAYVTRAYVTKDLSEDITAAFHRGQIVNCTILKVDPKAQKMSGSLTTVPFWPEKKREKSANRNDQQKNVKKRKVEPEQESETATKKQKQKKDKKPKEGSDDETQVENKRKRKRDKTSVSEDERTDPKISEESDAIETDIQDEKEILTPQDMHLIDMSDCTTKKHYKKRIMSLLKSIKCRTKRIEVIEKKIEHIEEKGLHRANKKYHTAMHSEILIVEQRIKKLAEALKVAEEKLKEFPEEDTDGEQESQKDKKAAKKDKKLVKKDNKTGDNDSGDVDKVIEDKKAKLKDKMKEIKVAASTPALDVPSAKDFWADEEKEDPKVEDDDDLSSSDDEQSAQPKKKRKKLTVTEKVAKARDEEDKLRKMELAAIEGASRPRSVEQFERALLANPDSSQLWIAYMAFHLQSTEIDKARAVSRKALSGISFREELERLNVWLALLNLEYRFGTKETQQKTLEEALQMNDTFKVHSKLLDIFTDTANTQELTALVDLMIRKYKREPKTFTLCGAACYALGLIDKARHVMQKAISVLDKKEHVSVLVQFALLERDAGDRERAEALFEQILGVYPQRVDVTATYVDMLYKGGDVGHVRQVLERMTSQKLPARKMKVLYKKWIEVEEKIGEKTEIERIKQKATEYIEKAKF